VTGAPSYALAWPFLDLVHLCELGAERWSAAAKLGARCWSWVPSARALELCWALEGRRWELGAGCWAPSSPEKSKAVTGASFYASAWTFPEPVQSCATIRGLCQALQQNVKW
jgi:hypothetical protein